jgi:protein-disulfide isomerase
MSQRTDVSLSAKQFPFCSDCNRHIGRNMHPNACRAARAAEAAGILRGDDGFWQMHYWLFDRGGAFTDDELRKAMVAFGYDPAQFLAVMQGPETLRVIQADIEEGKALGLHFTPMIFINGEELHGWTARNAVTRAVEAVAATSPPPGDPTQDRPPTAREKYIGDWRAQPVRRVPSDPAAWTIGPTDAPVHFVVWGDYQEPITAEADRIMQQIVASRDDTRYTFRHYPVNKDCNPVTPASLYPLACRMSQAAEAAGRLGGSHGYWAMHAWLMDHQRQFSEEAVIKAAASIGLDTQRFVAEMGSAGTAAEIAADATAARDLGLRGVPFIFVNGKRVPRWRVGNEEILGGIADEAAEP